MRGEEMRGEERRFVVDVLVCVRAAYVRVLACSLAKGQCGELLNLQAVRLSDKVWGGGWGEGGGGSGGWYGYIDGTLRSAHDYVLAETGSSYHAATPSGRQKD